MARLSQSHADAPDRQIIATDDEAVLWHRLGVFDRAADLGARILHGVWPRRRVEPTDDVPIIEQREEGFSILGAERPQREPLGPNHHIRVHGRASSKTQDVSRLALTSGGARGPSF